MPFDPIRPGAEEFFGADFAERLRDFDGVTVDTATASLSVLDDGEADADPEDILGSPVVNSDTKVSVMISPDDARIDVHYCLEIRATMSDDQVMIFCDDFWVRECCV